MNVGRLILVETSSPGNLGAALRVAANFGVRRVALVRPRIDPADPEIHRWACGADDLVTVETFDELIAAACGSRTLIATASGRGRPDQPLLTPDEAFHVAAERGLGSAALVFGGESRGLARDDLARCDLAVRIPTDPDFPVLNLTQAIAIVLAFFPGDGQATTPPVEPPASAEAVAGLMDHLETTLSAIGYLDPANPQRILRKIRRVFGRAGITANETAIFRGICRQVDWAADRRRDDDSEIPGGRFNQND